MTGRDWFIVGARLIGLWILFQGFQQLARYLIDGMFFANMYLFFEYRPVASYLWNGLALVVLAIFLLLKTEMLATWCYGKPVAPQNNHDEEHEDDDWPEDEDEEFVRE